MFNAADTDGSGSIDYSEWIAATINKKKVLTNEKLEYAFNLFDRNGNGSIDTEEVKTMLGIGKNISEDIWNGLIEQVDINGDGVIQFNEFKIMMLSLLD